MADNALVRFGFGLLPTIAAVAAFLTTKDMMCQQLAILLVFLLGIVIFDKLIKPLDWERQYGKELSNWIENTNLIICWLAAGMLLGFLLWITSYASSFLINISVETLPFPFVPSLTLRWIYWIMVMITHSLVIPVAEEYYFRCLIGDGKVENSMLNNFVSAVCFGLHYFTKYFFTYPETAKVAVWIGIMMFIFSFIQNTTIKSSFSVCCAFNIGVSLNWSGQN